ncbi:MAG: nucleoside hydrolase [Proteobacteria bacterium]|nr:nucleoside hydrolase [Pseudomonadota bacterium]
MSTPIAVWANESVWIDTDPACGFSASSDVDDCLALVMALNSPELNIRGVSTIYGNEELEVSQKTIGTLWNLMRDHMGEKSLPPVYRGAYHNHSRSMEKTAATFALVEALQNEKLTIVALGPLTNIAALLHHYPELKSQIKSIIAIAGKRPNERFYPGENRLTIMRDFNFKKDRTSFASVFKSDVDLTLVGFEAASHIKLTSVDLRELDAGSAVSKWLSRQSLGWLKLWNETFENNGFYPFDSLAVGYAIDPAYLNCQRMNARIKNLNFVFWESPHEIEVSHQFSDQRAVTFCLKPKKSFHPFLLQRLIAAPTG